MKKKDISWSFIGSFSRAPIGCENMRHLEHLQKQEHRLYQKYLNMDDKAPPVKVDLRKVSTAFYDYNEFRHFLVNPFDVLPKKKQDLIDHLEDFFSQSSKAMILIFAGEAGAGGEWSFCPSSEPMSDFIFTFMEFYDLWQKRRKKDQHLLLILDSPHSGNWPRQFSNKGELSISCQASCRYWQNSVEDKKLGGWFLHSLCKTLRKAKKELIHEPSLIEQTPCFSGSFIKVDEVFGLKLKFEYWSDMRKAMGASKYGNWPRLGTGKLKIKPMSLNGKEVKFEGDVDSNGLMSGLGKLLGEDGKTAFEGHFAFGKKAGHGIEYNENGFRLYDGMYENDLRHGEGKLFDENGNMIFEGTFKKGLLNGKGIEYHSNGKVKFQGKFKNGVREGSGVEFWESGNIRYKGFFKNGFINGECEEYDKDGRIIFRGKMVEGLYDGDGELYYPNGIMQFKGVFKKGKFNGYGYLYNNEGKLISEGNFENGLINGKAITYYLNGDIMYVGEFQESVPLGIGEIRSLSGSVINKGKTHEVLREVVMDKWFREARQGTDFKPVEADRKMSSREGSPTKRSVSGTRPFSPNVTATLPNNFQKRTSVITPILEEKEKKSVLITQPIERGKSLVVDAKQEETGRRTIDLQNRFVARIMTEKDKEISMISEIKSTNNWFSTNQKANVSKSFVSVSKSPVKKPMNMFDQSPTRKSQTMNYYSENKETSANKKDQNFFNFVSIDETAENENEVVEIDGDRIQPGPNFSSVMPQKEVTEEDFENLRKKSLALKEKLKKKNVFTPTQKYVERTNITKVRKSLIDKDDQKFYSHSPKIMN